MQILRRLLGFGVLLGMRLLIEINSNNNNLTQSREHVRVKISRKIYSGCNCSGRGLWYGVILEEFSLAGSFTSHTTDGQQSHGYRKQEMEIFLGKFSNFFGKHLILINPANLVLLAITSKEKSLMHVFCLDNKYSQ